jgi:hypothetical protein
MPIKNSFQIPKKYIMNYWNTYGTIKIAYWTLFYQQFQTCQINFDWDYDIGKLFPRATNGHLNVQYKLYFKKCISRVSYQIYNIDINQ